MAAKTYFLICLVLSLLPFFIERENVQAGVEFVWPSIFEGRSLTRLPLSEKEKIFIGSFPGQTARFHDGEREVIMRIVTTATRKLHSAAECLKAHGCAIKHLPIYKDDKGRLWSCFSTKRNGQSLKIREYISDDRGRQWSDVSAWYWHALFNESEGPWTVICVAEVFDEL